MKKSLWRLPISKLSLRQRIIRTVVIFTIPVLIVQLIFDERTEMWEAEILLGIIGSIVGGVMWALIEHSFFTTSTKGKPDERYNRR